MPYKNPNDPRRLEVRKRYFKRHQIQLQHERQTNPRHQNAQRRSMLKQRYGITDADYQRMLKAQNGVCACCGGGSRGRAYFDVDHDHITERVRGLLCHVCNKYVGALENAKRTAAEAYLTRQSEYDPR